MSKEKEVAIVEENKISEATNDALRSLMSADTEEYQDDTNMGDLQIPRLKILQAMSPELQKANVSKYVEGTEAGDLFNTLTQKTIRGDEGLLFVPIKRRVIYLEWKGTDGKGVLVNNYEEDDSAFHEATINKEGLHISKTGNNIVKTYETLGFVIDIENKDFQTIMISMSKTQTKKMKKFNSLIRLLQDPVTKKQFPEYAGVYKITSIIESNDHGSWFNYEIDFKYKLDAPELKGLGSIIYNKAKELRESYQTVSYKTNYKEEEPIEVSEKI